MLGFDDAEVMTSIPLVTVAHLVAGELFASPDGGVRREQLALPKSFLSYFHHE
jgi:hypothetical protein